MFYTRKFFLTICLLSVLNSGYAKSTNGNNNNQQYSANNSAIDINEIKSKAE